MIAGWVTQVSPLHVQPKGSKTGQKVSQVWGSTAGLAVGDEVRCEDVDGQLNVYALADLSATYVAKAGDTMTGPLSVGAYLSAADGDTIFSLLTNRPWVVVQRGTGGGTRTAWTNPSTKAMDWERVDGTLLFRINQSDNTVTVAGNFDVTGTKNACIADPDAPHRAYRFAAVEADEAGVLVKRFRNIAVGPSKETRIAVPEHFARIGADPMVFATHATAPNASDPRGPWAYVEGWDTGNPEVVLRAPQGTYHLLLTFCRADAAADGWEHIGTVDPPPDDATLTAAPTGAP